MRMSELEKMLEVEIALSTNAGMILFQLSLPSVWASPGIQSSGKENWLAQIRSQMYVVSSNRAVRDIYHEEPQKPC